MATLRYLLCAVLAAALVAPGAADARAKGVRATLDAMAADGALAPDRHDSYVRDWRRARRAARRLHGGARWNLHGVLANTRSLASRGMLEARLTPVFLTIERNFEWFWSARRAAPAYGSRQTFEGSPVIFQLYPGSGWQIQPLANFGRLNALARSRRTEPETLRGYADALLALAVERRGFLAFEYYFPWESGGPGWISGMTTATGMQALARVSRRTGERRYSDAGARMADAFLTSPPWGVRLRRGHGRAHYLQYSQSPRELIGNAFAQALIGLDTFVRIAADPRARLALERGLAQAEVGIDRYDTGAWSLYWRRPGTRRGAESDLHYHQLFEGFLAKLCARFPDGGFCGVHDRFARYETEPVEIGPLRARRHGHTLRVTVRASKRGTGTLTLVRRDHVVRRAAVTLARGTNVVRWRAPHRHRRYRLEAGAVSLNGIASSAERSLRLR